MTKHLDERIIATRQRWGARGFALLFIALAIDLIARAVILKQDPRQYLDIGLIWMATILYVSIGMSASGVALFGGRWWKAWPFIPAVAVWNMAASWWTGAVRSPVELITSITLGIIGATAGLFLLLLILRGIYATWESVTLGRGPREE